MAALFLIGIIVGVIATLFNPFAGLYAFTVFLYIKPGIFSVILAMIRPNLLFGALTLLMVFLGQGKKKKLVFFKDIPSKWFLMFGVMMAFSMITSIWRGNTYSFIVYFLKTYIAYFLILNLVTSLNRYRAIIWSMIASMVYIGWMSIRAYYSGGWAGRMFGAFHGALFDDPNDLALGFTILLPFLFFDLFRKGGFWRKTTQLGIMGLFLWGIILTQSRGGFLGLAAMLLILWFKSRYKVRLAIIGFVVLALFWQAAPQSFRDRMTTIQTASDDDPAAISRRDAWKAGFNMMKSRVFGVGAGNFGEGFVLYRPEGAVDYPGMRRAAHNMYMQVGGETGFPGLIVFIGMIFAAFKSLNKVKKGALYQKSGGQEDHSAKNPADRKGAPPKVRRTEGEQEYTEIGLLADATFVSLAGYCASGMFLSQAYNFVLYYFIAFSVVLLRISNESQKGSNTLKVTSDGKISISDARASRRCAIKTR